MSAIGAWPRAAAAVGALLLALAVLAERGLAQSDAPATAAPSLAEGEVRRVDKAAGKITLRHGDIPNLEMPPMTMVFRVQDPALLERVKVGEKIRFTAEKIGGQYTVTGIQTNP